MFFLIGGATSSVDVVDANRRPGEDVLGLIGAGGGSGGGSACGGDEFSDSGSLQSRKNSGNSSPPFPPGRHS